MVIVYYTSLRTVMLRESETCLIIHRYWTKFKFNAYNNCDTCWPEGPRDSEVK